MLKLRCEEGIEFFKELKEECGKKIKYRFYSDCLNMYSMLFNRAYRIETYGPVPRVFNKLGPLSVDVSFGEKNNEKHVIMYKNKAIIHFVVRGKHVKWIEEYEDECRKEVYRLYRESPRIRYYLDEDYMLKWLKRYLEVVGSVEVRRVGRKVGMKLSLEDMEKVFGKKRCRTLQKSSPDFFETRRR